MTDPKLLVALRPREEVGRALREQLPDVESQYVSEGPPGRWESVEAMLLGSVERDLGALDVRGLPNLRFVQRVYTGMDGVPFDRFPSGVRFAGNVGAYAPFVAEHAVTIALAAAREIPRAHLLATRGTLRPPPNHRMLWRRTAVILGYGEIGRAIAARLTGFDVRVLGLNRNGAMAPGADGMFAADHLLDAVAQGDFLFECRPLTRQTRGSIDASVLSTCKPNAILVNVGRGATVREEDLFHHLQSHPEFRAALDVWWNEEFVEGRIVHGFPFGELPNFLGTPHCAGFGPGVETYVLGKALENLRRFFAGAEPRHLVDRSEYE